MVNYKNAEAEGFEPSRGFLDPRSLANCCLKPLGHASVSLIITYQIGLNKASFCGIFQGMVAIYWLPL